MNNNSDLTESQKRLLQKFPHMSADDPLVEMMSWNASLEQKVDNFGDRLDIWTKAILDQTHLIEQQNQLITSQNLTLQETTKSYTSFGKNLTQFEQGLTQLQRESRSLLNTIESHGATLKSFSDQNQRISQKLDELSLKLNPVGTLKTLNDQVDNLTIDSRNIKGDLNVNFYSMAFLGVAILAFQATQLVGYLSLSDNLQSAIYGVRERTEWALTKLERLENR